MLTAERNRQLTEVGPGTPMGKVLRRHWHPVAVVVDSFDSRPVQPVRLLGEDWVLFRATDGGYGLVDRHCAHRRADLAYGFVDDGGLRCHHHGWMFAADGRCVAKPYEDIVDPACRLREKACLRAGLVQIVFADIPCNWLQAQEKSIDPVHFEWMHANWSRRLAGRVGPEAPRHLRVAFKAFAQGFVYKRIIEDSDESNPLWTIGRVCLWPNGFFLGDHFERRVPVDDTHTLSVLWSFIRVPNESEPFVQRTIRSWRAPLKHPDGRCITSHVIDQDIVAWGAARARSPTAPARRWGRATGASR